MLFTFVSANGINTMPCTQDALQLIKFNEEHIQLGEVKHGAQREMRFTFVNISRIPVEIDIVSSCECTTLDWTNGLILPGESGEIHAIFDSSLKEKSETVDVDVILKNTDPHTGNPIMIILDYTYNLLK